MARNAKTLKMVQMAILVAIILILGFTNLGFIPINPLISLTVTGIPVIIGACLLGKGAGAILGGFFGMMSFLLPVVNPAAAGVVFQGLFASSPILLFVTCLVPRIAMGFLTGLIAEKWGARTQKKALMYAVTGVIGSLINTFLFMGFVLLFFNGIFMEAYGNDAALFLQGMIILPFCVNGPIEAAASGAINCAVCKAVSVTMRKR